MAKALGLIGNFKGKLGNTVGYSLKDSNNKQTQGVRVYQPIVRNPKTAAQAEQRAKLAPINATYRALKMVIDRGQEGKAYGNKSRLAWLSAAMKAFNGGWFNKGAVITAPAIVPLTKGSLSDPFGFETDDSILGIDCYDGSGSAPANMGALATGILAHYPSLKEGDQITFVIIGNSGSSLESNVSSIVLDTTSTAQIPSFLVFEDGSVNYVPTITNVYAGNIVVSREGDNGAHLRSNTNLVKMADYPTSVLTDDAKQAAIESYMSQGANTDWAEESLM